MIIGLTGTIGSGKNMVAKYLMKRHGFVARFGSDVLAEELKRQGLPLTRDNFHTLANDIRASGKHILLSDPMFQKLAAEKNDIVLGFFRTPLELSYVKECFPAMVVIAVDAPVASRFQRIQARAEEKDSVSAHEFFEQDEREKYSSDPLKHNVSACMELADFTIWNDSTIEKLHEQIEKILQLARKK